MKNKKIVLQISTTENLKKQFKEIAKNQGYTISGLANKIFNDYIKKNKVEQWHLKMLNKS